MRDPKLRYQHRWMLGGQQEKNDALDRGRGDQKCFMEKGALSLALKTEEHLIWVEGVCVPHLQS